MKMKEKNELNVEITWVVSGSTVDVLRRECTALENLKEEKQVLIHNLLDEATPGKITDKKLLAYEGQEGDLLKNLEKMESSQKLNASQTDSTNALETNMGKECQRAHVLLRRKGGRADPEPGEEEFKEGDDVEAEGQRG